MTAAGRAPAAARLRALRKKVWEHYRTAGRKMPWRETRDPYRILVSEVMLQQTQVERVRPKYAEFLAAFPDAAALAGAPLARLLGVWRGLGYNRRALNLQRAARLLVERHGGRVPDDAEALRALPGIGAATAAAVRAFAFEAPVVLIETNVRRVFIHEFFPRREAVADAELLPLVAAALDRRRPREWYYALMDYGAALARRVPNPNRRSRSWTRQGHFEGSDRQLRGAILRQLLDAGPATPARLAAALAGPADGGGERVRRLVADLVREGFVARAGRRLRIAGEGGGP